MARRKGDANGGAQSEQLSRERIVDASLGLLEEEGWEALSMRRLAQQLDVWPMAVYRYFRDKDELVDALVEHAVETMSLPAASGDWRERLHALLGAAHITLERLPPELRSRLGSVLFSPAAPGLTEAGIALLRSAGFDDAGSRRAWSALGAYTAGFVEISPDAGELGYGLDRLLDGLEMELGAVAGSA